MAEKLTTLMEIINFSSKLLKEKGIKDSRLNVELMFCDILRCDRMKIYLDFDKPLNQDEISKFKIMLKRRLNYEPLQYILGKTNFYGYTIKVNENVLIPRIETEILVDKVLDDIINTCAEKVNIFEIGTGSGCIAIALSKELSKKNISHFIKAIDISEDAIKIAKENAVLNKIPSEYIMFEINDFLSDTKITENYDYIIANPPYIPLKDLKYLDKEIRNYEPTSALTDGEEGLNFYVKIFSLKDKIPIKTKIFLEIGDGQRKRIEGLVIKKDIKDYHFYKDYINIDRLLKIN